jgi:hypothetical protein
LEHSLMLMSHALSFFFGRSVYNDVFTQQLWDNNNNDNNNNKSCSSAKSFVASNNYNSCRQKCNFVYSPDLIFFQSTQRERDETRIHRHKLRIDHYSNGRFREWCYQCLYVPRRMWSRHLANQRHASKTHAAATTRTRSLVMEFVQLFALGTKIKI